MTIQKKQQIYNEIYNEVNIKSVPFNNTFFNIYDPIWLHKYNNICSRQSFLYFVSCHTIYSPNISLLYYSS